MDAETRRKAVGMLREKLGGDPSITYADISSATGYSERHLKRMAGRIREGADPAAHGNAGSRPANAASEAEVRYLRELKRPYPNVTIAHFRDIYHEDVVHNPRRAYDVERLGLTERSASFFRDLFAREGWRSPAQRRPSPGRPREEHPTRPPAPCRGMLCQLDATPDDWLAGLGAHAMHSAVDDATSEVLGAWFMPTECLRGYARAMRQVVVRHGVPEAAYVDRSSIFRRRSDGSPTQFAEMMGDLGVRMVLASTPQAKGRVERAHRTIQLRLPTDCLRFGISDYDRLNEWFNGYYAPYINAKFAFAPRDPADRFGPAPSEAELARVFRRRETRRASGGVIAYGGSTWALVDALGEVRDPGPGAAVGVYTDAVDGSFYAEVDGRRLSLVEVGRRDRRGPVWLDDELRLQDYLREMGRDGAAG